MPYLPEPSLTGQSLEHDWREISDSIFYLLAEGSPWRELPDFFLPGPGSTTLTISLTSKNGDTNLTIGLVSNCGYKPDQEPTILPRS